MKRAAPQRKRWKKVPIMQWMNLTKSTCLVMNSDRMHQHQPHHHHHHQNQHHHHHHQHTTTTNTTTTNITTT